MVAIYTDAFRPKIDGVAICIERLVKEYIRRGVPYDLYAPNTPGEYKELPSTYRFQSLPLIFQPEVRFSIPIDGRLVTRAFTHDYDLIHSHTPGPVGFLAYNVSKVRAIPHIHTFHTYLPDYSHYILNGKVLSIAAMTRISVFWANRMSRIVTPSNKIKTWLEHGGVKRTIDVIPNGLDLAQFSPQSKGKRYLIDRGFITGNEFVLLYVGRIAKEKSVDVLVASFSELITSTANNEQLFRDFPGGIKLLIVGDGPAVPDIKRYVEKNGLQNHVVFTGYVATEEIHRVFGGVEVFTFMSKSETQGMVVAEAAASGLPVVVARDEAYEGMVMHQKNGYYIDNQQEFTSAIIELIQDPVKRKQMGENSVALVSKFSIESTTTKLLELYSDSVLSRKSRRKPQRQRFVVSVGRVRALLLRTAAELRAKIDEHV